MSPVHAPMSAEKREEVLAEKGLALTRSTAVVKYLEQELRPQKRTLNLMEEELANLALGHFQLLDQEAQLSKKGA